MKLGRRGRWVGKATGERGGDVTAKDNDAWRDATEACLNAVVKLLSQDSAPTKEAAETALMLADAANKFSFVPFP